MAERRLHGAGRGGRLYGRAARPGAGAEGRGTMTKEIRDVVWITGASSGIGRALALRMARGGYRVAATARRAGELEALAQEADGLVVPFVADTTDAASLKAAVTRIEETM